jgi:quercetin dioxygenase-like cupin family protein
MTVTNIPPAHDFSYESARLRIYHANKGEGLAKHNHTYSHASFCMAGSVLIRKEGREFVVTKDTQPVNLVPVEWHEIEALEDGTVFCNVFADEFKDLPSNYFPDTLNVPPASAHLKKP